MLFCMRDLRWVMHQKRLKGRETDGLKGDGYYGVDMETYQFLSAKGYAKIMEIIVYGR